MRIGIIGDTHLKKHCSKLKTFLVENMRDIDMIIHVGDFTSPDVIEILKSHCRFEGVYGNNDGTSIKEKVPDKIILSIEGYRIGVYHGHGDKKQTLDNVMKVFKDEKLNIIIFGHSHKPAIFTKGNTLFLNPGSITYKRRDPWFTYIILELQTGKKINASLKLFC